MGIDSLIGTLVRHSNRKILNFPEAAAGTPLPAPETDRPYLLYLHIPYCVVLCPFCSFHRVRFNQSSAARYFACLQREIELVTDAGYRFDELYFGGGTPTVLPDELTGTISRLRELHAITEISVETNPDDLGKDSLEALRDAGVNRLSVGVQSFDDELLREMERYEKYGSGDDIRKRLRAVNGTFDTLNVDMIFNFPHQTEASLQRDLDFLIDDVGVDQVSFYPLMTVKSTARKMLRNMGRVDPSREKRLYQIIADRLLAADYTRTSAWCFSRKAGMFDEYIVEREEYVGLGSGAFSYLQGSLYASTFSINHYLKLTEAGKTGTVRRRVMSPHDQMAYYLLMRLFSGSLNKAAAEKRFGGRFHKGLWIELAGLRAIRAIVDTGDTLKLTERGYYLWVVMMREFFTGVNTLRDNMRQHISAERSALKTD